MNVAVGSGGAVDATGQLKAVDCAIFPEVLMWVNSDRFTTAFTFWLRIALPGMLPLEFNKIKELPR